METNEKNKTIEEAKPVAFDENSTCDRCGRIGAYDFGEEKLCQDCYVTRGSCCLEFGKDDLWEFERE